MKKKKKKVWLWIVLAVVAVIVLGGWLLLRSLANQIASVDYKTYTVKTGTVTRTITGSGRLTADRTESVKAESNLVIESVSVQVGDAVTEGDVLAVYSKDSIRDRIDALYSDITSLDSQIRTASMRETVTAPTAGRVKEIYAAAGVDLESVMKENGALALLSSDDLMTLTIETDAELTLGNTVSVYVDGKRYNGTVANTVTGGYRITVPDSKFAIGALAEVYNGETKIGEGALFVHAPIFVYATDGTVESVNVSVNSMVSAGGRLFTLAEKPQSAAYALAVESRNEKAEQIGKLYALLENPVLFAPTDGIVAMINAREDSTVTGEAFVLHTGGAAKMTISVDELDIGVVSLGQHTNITLDAFAGESFSAEVTHISLLGTVAGSITTYAVELTLEPDERFLEGMNGSATVIAQQKDNVLLIPVEAIFEDETGVYVYVQTSDGSVRRDIVTGLSDGMNAEVLSGLSAGDVVQYQASYISLIDQYRQMGMQRGGN